jgi:3-deoxy-manno-octulosonate cytidylyltransferase (CMP-KDO synthetase)
MDNPNLSPGARRVLIIPARRRSTRLPDKLLLRDTGKTVLQHTFEAASQAMQPEAVLIAVDDMELAREARRFGAHVVMTSESCRSGTDRVAEAARQLPDAEIIVNLQGDEPDVNPQTIDRLFAMLTNDQHASMATLATPIRCRKMLEDPACVKVVCDAGGRAIYFSRSVIPHPRDWNNALLSADPPNFYQHLGVYAYRRDLLFEMSALPVGRLERLESLEQLRVLEHGRTILVAAVEESTRGIDTPADYAAFVARRKAG